MVKISALPAEATPTSDDLLAMVDNAGAVTKKVTAEDLVTAFPAGSIAGSQIADSGVTTAKILDANVTTAKIANDAVTDAKLVYGKVRSRQGSHATNWLTAGTTAYDVSASATFIQVGSANTSSGAVTVTFPTAFTYVPVVFATVNSASGSNCFVRITGQSNASFIATIITDGGSLGGAETITWMAVGI